MELPLGANLLVFSIAAAVAWVAGVVSARSANVIAEHGTGQALIGSLFLGAIASLPALAMAIFAALLGSPSLAINTLLGGIGVSVVILAVADFAGGRKPLSSDITHPIVLLEAALVIIVLAILVAGVAVGDTPVLGVGLWSSALLVLYVISIPVIRRYQRRVAWAALDAAPSGAAPSSDVDAAATRRSLRRPIAVLAITSVVLLVAGFALASSADGLARQTGLGAGPVGLVLGGLATSLPELSSTISAVRLRQYEMAFSDAFGTNLFSVMLVFWVDLAYARGPVLNAVGTLSSLGALLGIVLTSIYVAGIVVRPRRSVLRMGWDSILVLVVAAVAFALFTWHLS